MVEWLAIVFTQSTGSAFDVWQGMSVCLMSTVVCTLLVSVCVFVGIQCIKCISVLTFVFLRISVVD